MFMPKPPPGSEKSPTVVKDEKEAPKEEDSPHVKKPGIDLFALLKKPKTETAPEI